MPSDGKGPYINKVAGASPQFTFLFNSHTVTFFIIETNNGDDTQTEDGGNDVSDAGVDEADAAGGFVAAAFDV